MFCPNCKDSVLQMTERKGIEIDYCSNCRGVWLDRGELDKIIEKSLPMESPNLNNITNNVPDRPQQQYDRDRSSDYKYKRKKSFLEEIFD